MSDAKHRPVPGGIGTADACPLGDSAGDDGARRAASTDVYGAGHAWANPSDTARTIVASGTHAMLATIGAPPVGAPLGSLVGYTAKDDGDALVVLPAAGEPTNNARRDGRASLLVVEPIGAGHDPLDAGRVTLVGYLRPVGPDGQAEAAARVIDAVPALARYADVSWSPWRLTPTSLRWVGAFGAMAWIDISDYRAGVIDPVLARRHYVCDHMNDDHADACLAIVRHAVGRHDIIAARMTGADRFGCDYHATAPAGGPAVHARVPYDRPVASVAEAAEALVAQAHRAMGG